MPEYIERFFLEAYRSFGGTVAPVKGRKGVWSISRVPPDLRKLPDSLERKYGKIGAKYPQITFDKEKIVGYSDLEFVGPGHSLFEGVVERVLRQYGPALRNGAVFYNADATEPTVLWLLKCGVAVILTTPQEVVRSLEGMESDPEVEKIAVEVSMRYERDQGRKPVSVEEENCGWDVTSLDGGQVARYIEVKGRAGEGGVALTPNE